MGWHCPSFIIYGSDGREAARGGEGNYRDWTKGFVAVQEGTFTVVVQGYYANQAGTYHLRLAKAPGNFMTPGGDDGGGMENGGNYEGSITPGDLDLWTFTAEAGDLVLLRMGTTGIYPSFIVYGADGREVARGEDGNYRDKVISFAATKSETFTVLVQSYYVTSDGSYNLRLAKVPGEFIIPGGDEGGLMENGGNHEGSITIGDVDIWTFTAEAGDLVSFRIGTTDIYPLFTVHGMDGREVARSGDGNYRDSGTAFVATQGGTYTVLVQSYYPTGDGAYNLRLAKVPGPFIIPGGDEGGPLTNGDNHQGAIFVGDVDLWTLNARMGDVVWLRVATTDIYPSFVVHGPDGQIVVRGGDGNYRDAATSFVAAQNGIFTVKIGSYYLGGDGTYAMRLAQIPDRFIVSPDDEGGALTNGTNQLSAILQGDIDLWTFEADQGQNLLIRMQELSGNVSPSLVLYGPTGALVASHTQASLAQLSLRAPDGGIYTLVATSGVLGGAGTYQLIVSGLPEQGRQLRFSRQSTPQQGQTFTINWPTELGGHVLQQNTVVSDEGWVDVDAPTLANGLNTRFTLPVEPGNRFFRLRRIAP